MNGYSTKANSVLKKGKMLYLCCTQGEKAEDFSSAFVRMTGIEPAHLAASDPKSDVSTSSTTSAF